MAIAEKCLYGILPSGAIKIHNRSAIRLNYEEKCVEIYSNSPDYRWGEEENWCLLDKIYKEEDESKWILQESLNENVWLALAYFWMDIQEQ